MIDQTLESAETNVEIVSIAILTLIALTMTHIHCHSYTDSSYYDSYPLPFLH